MLFFKILDSQKKLKFNSTERKTIYFLAIYAKELIVFTQLENIRNQNCHRLSIILPEYYKRYSYVQLYKN